MLAAWHFSESKPSFHKTESALPDSLERNILAEIISLNNDKNRPSSTFRKGHVTDAALDNYLHKTNDGYYIQLPSTTMVPTPAVINGQVFVSGGFGSKQYYAFDAATGQKKWAVSLDDDGPSSPAIQDGIVVFNTESCTIFACDLASGKPIWSYWLGDPLMSMPTIANGIVFTAYPAAYPQQVTMQKGAKGYPITPSHVLIAIELKTGAILWQKWIDSDVMSAPVAKDDLVYVTTFSGALYKVKQKTGEILEARAMRATSAPVFAANDLILSQRADHATDGVAREAVVIGYGVNKKEVYSKRADYLDKKVQSQSKLKGKAAGLDAGNGFAGGAPENSNWKAAHDNIGQSNVSTLQAFQGSRSLYMNGDLYNTMGDELVCTNKDGTLKWKHKLSGDLVKEGGSMGTPPIYANGYIIIATYTGEVLVMGEKNGSVIKKYQVGGAIRYQPVVDKGWIFVTTENGRLYAINTGDARITGWNMWGGNARRTNAVEHLN
jgi:outer membrane protein assembly factor BamB